MSNCLSKIKEDSERTELKIMKLNLFTFLLFFISIFASLTLDANTNINYLNYHSKIAEAESLIGDERFREAITIYEEVFNFYDFVFLRDYLVAAQISFYINEKQKAFSYIKKSIAAGLELKALKKNKFLRQFQVGPEWMTIEKEYDSLRLLYVTRIDLPTRENVHSMFNKDQRKALGTLFKIGDKAQEKYATNKFAPHSEIQMAKLITMLENKGYPGEKLIGNDFWMATIISHHNSISQAYSKNDTIYRYIRPRLIQAIKAGQMSPYEFALIDDWQKAISSDRSETGYGFLNPPKKSTLSETDEFRQRIGLRTIGLRNKLVETEKSTGMNFYLPDWVRGKISIEQN